MGWSASIIYIDKFRLITTNDSSYWKSYSVTDESEMWIGNIALIKSRGKLWHVCATSTEEIYHLVTKEVFFVSKINLTSKQQRLKYLRRCCKILEEIKVKELWDGMQA